MQRISLAIGCSMRPDILLLDGKQSQTPTLFLFFEAKADPALSST